MSQLPHLLAAGQALLAANRIPDAERHFRAVAAQHPHEAAAHHALGVALIHLQRHNEAIASFEHSLALQPAPEAYLNLIQLYTFTGQKTLGVEKARTAAAAFPGDPRILAELARALERAGSPDEALRVCESGLARFPNFPLLVVHSANLLFTRGRVAEAIALYRRCLAAHPQEHRIHSSLLFSLHFLPGTTAQALYDEHLEWNRRHAEPLAGQIRPHPNSRLPDRPLRVGYVSPDFRNHGIGRFVAPLLERHNPDRIMSYVYSDVHTPDAFTQRIRAAAGVYRTTFNLSDAQLADLVRSDQIDILVDLTMHMPSSRLLAFARKPAPIQVTYLAYCSTTGLPQMDYRITDPFLDPGGELQSPFYTERSLFIPSYWCYEAPAEAPAISDVPRDPGRPITFGCLNNIAKVSHEARETWAAILRRVPDSQLLLHGPEGDARGEVCDHFRQLQIDPARLQFAGRLPLPDYLRLHGQCDIALDPFPYNGGTTSCDALFMGTPVITLAPEPGALAISRAGVSLLSQVGLQRLIARSVPEYIELAGQLSRDADQRAAWRVSLRPAMQNSPLMNALHFNAALEAAYREIWSRWCRNQ